MAFWRKKKQEEPDERQEIREQLKAVSDNSRIERDSFMSGLENSYSLVCFVNDDMPYDRKLIHTNEVVAEFFFFEGQKLDSQKWHERQKEIGKRESIIVYRVPAEDMVALYAEHTKRRREGITSPFKSVSAIIYNGSAYPVAFCLGFLWGKDTTPYNHYKTYTL